MNAVKKNNNKNEQQVIADLTQAAQQQLEASLVDFSSQLLNLQQQQLQQISQQLLQVRSYPAVSAQTKVQGSLTDLISSSARTHKIQVSRMQPQNDQMQVMLNDISFDQLLAWLHELQYQHNVSIVQLDLAVADAPGMVRVRRVLVES